VQLQQSLLAVCFFLLFCSLCAQCPPSCISGRLDVFVKDLASRFLLAGALCLLEKTTFVVFGNIRISLCIIMIYQSSHQFGLDDNVCTVARCQRISH